jgi:hypothetical protein
MCECLSEQVRDDGDVARDLMINHENELFWKRNVGTGCDGRPISINGHDHVPAQTFRRGSDVLPRLGTTWVVGLHCCFFITYNRMQHQRGEAQLVVSRKLG